MSFQQLPIQVGTERGLLRVLNTGRAQLPVRRVGLDWAGYGDAFLITEDNVLAPGQTVDFPVALPAPNCSHVSGPVVGVVDAGTATVRTPLDGPGSVLLRRNRRIACGEKLVQHRLAIEYGRSWRLTGAGAGTAMAGHLRLTRRTGSEEIRLVRAEEHGRQSVMNADMPGMMSAERMAALQKASGREFQSMWLEMMIEHHEGAVEMARTEVEDGENAKAVAMAKDIIGAQKKEVSTMQDLLKG